MTSGRKVFPLFLLFLGSAVFAASPQALEGDWSSACLSGFMRTEKFRASSVTLAEENFSDSGCRVLAARTESGGRYAMGIGGKYPEIDFTFSEVRIALFSKAYLDYYNANHMCGFSDWKPGEAKDITGLACDLYGTGVPIRVPKSGDMRYGIYELNERGELRFGRLTPILDGTSPEKRPVELDDRFFTRKE